MDEDTTMKDHDGDNDNNDFDDGSSPSDGPTTVELARAFIHAALALTPLSAQGQRAAMALGDDIARFFREREEAEERRAEEVPLGCPSEDRRAEADEATLRAHVEATVQQLRRDVEFAEARARAAEAALAELVPTHWSAAMLREASSQHERHIEATVKIAEGLGAPRVDLERALRQFIAQGSMHTSTLALDLLINPLGVPNDAATGQQRSRKEPA